VHHTHVGGTHCLTTYGRPRRIQTTVQKLIILLSLRTLADCLYFFLILKFDTRANPVVFHSTVFIRLEARLQPNIGFTFERTMTVFTHLDITPPKVTDLDEMWSTLSILSGAGPGRYIGRDPRSSEN